jgi:hypothetical protein
MENGRDWLEAAHATWAPPGYHEAWRAHKPVPAEATEIRTVPRAREAKPSGGTTRRARSPDGDSAGSTRGGDEPPPSADLTHAARAALRCGARLARRQRRRLAHHRRTAAA